MVTCYSHTLMSLDLCLVLEIEKYKASMVDGIFE